MGEFKEKGIKMRTIIISAIVTYVYLSISMMQLSSVKIEHLIIYIVINFIIAILVLVLSLGILGVFREVKEISVFENIIQEFSLDTEDFTEIFLQKPFEEQDNEVFIYYVDRGGKIFAKQDRRNIYIIVEKDGKTIYDAYIYDYQFFIKNFKTTLY